MTQQTIGIHGLRVRGRHGVLDFERRDGQEFVIDLEVQTGVPAGDELSQTIHYGDLAHGVADIVAGEPVNLIETLAQRIANYALTYPQTESVLVRVHKPQAPVELIFDDITVTIVRSRTDA